MKLVRAGAGEEGKTQHLDWSPFLLTLEGKAAGAWAGALLGGQALASRSPEPKGSSAIPDCETILDKLGDFLEL